MQNRRRRAETRVKFIHLRIGILSVGSTLRFLPLHPSPKSPTRYCSTVLLLRNRPDGRSCIYDARNVPAHMDVRRRQHELDHLCIISTMKRHATCMPCLRHAPYMHPCSTHWQHTSQSSKSVQPQHANAACITSDTCAYLSYISAEIRGFRSRRIRTIAVHSSTPSNGQVLEDLHHLTFGELLQKVSLGQRMSNVSRSNSALKVGKLIVTDRLSRITGQPLGSPRSAPRVLPP